MNLLSQLSMEVLKKINSYIQDEYVDLCCCRKVCRVPLNKEEFVEYIINSVHNRYQPFCTNCYENYSALKFKNRLWVEYTNTFFDRGRQFVFDKFLFWQDCKNCSHFLKEAYLNCWNFEGGSECCDLARQFVWKHNGKNKQAQKFIKKQVYTDEDLENMIIDFRESK